MQKDCIHCFHVAYFVLCILQLREVGNMRGARSDFLFPVLNSKPSLVLTCACRQLPLLPKELPRRLKLMCDVFMVLACCEKFDQSLRVLSSSRRDAPCTETFHTVYFVVCITASSESYQPQPQRYRC